MRRPRRLARPHITAHGTRPDGCESSSRSELLTSTPSAVSATALDDTALSGTPVVHLFVPVALPATSRASSASLTGRSVRVMPIGELLNLAEMATDGRLAPLEVMRMLEMGIPVDFVTGLLDRPGQGAAAPDLAVEPVPLAEPVTVGSRASGYWMASVPPDYATTPEEFLEVVVARRHVFGVTDRGTVVGTVRTGDGICFYLPGKGVVGHAWVASITDGANDLRDARRFRQVLRLDRLSLHLARPTSLDIETELRLQSRADHGQSPRADAARDFAGKLQGAQRAGREAPLDRSPRRGGGVARRADGRGPAARPGPTVELSPRATFGDQSSG